MSNVIVGQSGGPTAAINSSLAGVIHAAVKDKAIDKVYGSENGIAGILGKNIIDLSVRFSQEGNIDLLKTTPAAFLGSCRYKLPNIGENDEIYDKIFEVFNEYDIKYFFYIGGNDSMDTVLKLSRYARIKEYDVSIIGIPKTIDNDLGVTDHTPGYGSAAKYIATSMKEIYCDSAVYDLHCVTIVEIMGRNAGWLTASAALAKCDTFDTPDLIYLPERVFDFHSFLDDIKGVARNKKTIVVAVSEGVRLEDGSYVCESVSSGDVDAFGHKYLSGTGRVLESYVRRKLPYKVRSVELNVLQRAAGHCISKTDIDEAFSVGVFAFDGAMAGITAKMAIYKRAEGQEYKIKYEFESIEKIANREKSVPNEFINDAGNFVTEAFVKYSQPLIQGEIYPKVKNGIPIYLKR